MFSHELLFREPCNLPQSQEFYFGLQQPLVAQSRSSYFLGNVLPITAEGTVDLIGILDRVDEISGSTFSNPEILHIGRLCICPHLENDVDLGPAFERDLTVVIADTDSQPRKLSYRQDSWPPVPEDDNNRSIKLVESPNREICAKQRSFNIKSAVPPTVLGRHRMVEICIDDAVDVIVFRPEDPNKSDAQSEILWRSEIPPL